jgi:D-alanyl-D-alanine carboxypeptidase (penicillin-binding protein 5/6)
MKFYFWRQLQSSSSLKIVFLGQSCDCAFSPVLLGRPRRRDSDKLCLSSQDALKSSIFRCRKVLQLPLWLIAFFCCSLHAVLLQREVSAKSAILMNADTGAVLFEKNQHAPAFPASITKIATALYVLEGKNPDLERLVSVSAESIRIKPPRKEWSNLPAYWLEVDGSKMGLVKGEEISVESLLHGLLLASGNDAANVLAESMSRTVPDFVQELNHYLLELGCRNTHFVNPHGLHHPDHVTTAYDMALIAKKAMQNAKFREIVAKVSYQKPATNKHPEEKILQYNHLLRSGRCHYSKAIGIKTGHTSQAQNTLVAAAKQDERTLIAVVLGCEKLYDRYADATALFEAAFAEQKIHRTLFTGDEIYNRIIDGSRTSLQAALSQELAIDYYPAEEPDRLQAQICWSVPRLPIQKGAKVGEIRLIDAHGNRVKSEPLFAREKVQCTFLSMIKDWWNHLF